MANETNVVEQEPTQDPAEKPEAPKAEPKDAPEPEVSPLEEQNKQLFARAKKAEDREKELQAKIDELESQQVPSDDVTFDYVDDDTKKEVSDLRKRLDEIQDQAALDKLYAQFPDVQDKAAEFDEYRKEYPRHKLENVAKLFRAEQGLVDAPARKGLEEQTGGARTAPVSGKLSADDAKKLRENNYEKYRELLKAGKISLE